MAKRRQFADSNRVTPTNATLIGFRPIATDDASRLVDAFDRLSAESRYRRFLRPLRTLSDRDVHTFTHVDFVDHVAWVAELHADHSPVLDAGSARKATRRWLKLV